MATKEENDSMHLDTHVQFMTALSEIHIMHGSKTFEFHLYRAQNILEAATTPNGQLRIKQCAESILNTAAHLVTAADALLHPESLQKTPKPPKEKKGDPHV